MKASRSSLASVSMVATSGNWSSKVADDPVELLADGRGVGLGEDRLDGGDHHVGLGPLHPGQHVAHEVDPASLPGRSHHHRLDGGFQAQVLVRDDEPHARSPRARSERRNSVQKAPSSESPTAQPSTSRLPSIETPVATTTARETTWWSTRPFR